MILGALHSLGCLIVTLNDLGEADLDYEDSNTELPLVENVYKTPNLLKHIIDTRCSGAIAIWADAVTDKQYGGESLYKLLKKNGEHVERSEVVKNPSGSPRCALYYWYFREQPTKPVPGPTTPVRRKKVEKKAKTVARKSASKSRRSSKTR